MYIDPEFPEYWEQGVWVPQHWPESYGPGEVILTIYTNIPYLTEAINKHINVWKIDATWMGDAYGEIPGKVNGVQGLYRARHRYKFTDRKKAEEFLNYYGQK
jgi:hypothetical protein